ncbi:MAG: hypothetical protein GY906_15025 [bacterium]|nr:hypothetical protein [bacterium]
MARSNLHLHSMLVHSVVALLPMAAVAWILNASGVALGRLDPRLWDAMVGVCLFTVTLVIVPSVITGIGERNHKYARWHSTHKLKLALSVAMIAMILAELSTLLLGEPSAAKTLGFGAMVVGVNNAIGFGLSVLGLKITLGRQSWGRTSYIPDMSRKPPIDILEVNAVRSMEVPKIIDPGAEETAK